MTIVTDVRKHYAETGQEVVDNRRWQDEYLLPPVDVIAIIISHGVKKEDEVGDVNQGYQSKQDANRHLKNFDQLEFVREVGYTEVLQLSLQADHHYHEVR